MGKKIPTGYYIYFAISITVFLISWLYIKNVWYGSLLAGFVLGIPITYIIVIMHVLIEKLK